MRRWEADAYIRDPVALWLPVVRGSPGCPGGGIWSSALWPGYVPRRGGWSSSSWRPGSGKGASTARRYPRRPSRRCRLPRRLLQGRARRPAWASGGWSGVGACSSSSWWWSATARRPSSSCLRRAGPPPPGGERPQPRGPTSVLPDSRVWEIGCEKWLNAASAAAG